MSRDSKHRYKIDSVRQDNVSQYVSIAGEGLLAPNRSRWDTYLKRIGIENVRCVFAGTELIGGLAFYRMGQWFGGQAIDTAGFSGVAINPTWRGKGACGALLRSVLRELYEEEMPLASLYASTQALYRSVGFEQSGTQTQFDLPLASLAGMRLSDAAKELAVTRFDSPPQALLESVDEARGRTSNGTLRRTEGLWQRVFRPFDATEDSYIYVFGDLSAPEGYAVIRPRGRSEGFPGPLSATDIAVNTRAAAERMLQLAADHRSMSHSLSWCGSPDDILLALAPEQSYTVTSQMRWMNRIVHVQKAFASRGYPEHLNAEIHFDFTDDVLPENAGRWVLSVRDGSGVLERGGRGNIALNIQAAATLFTGFYSASRLAKLHWLSATSESEITSANAIFTGPAPWMPEIF